MTTLYLDLTRGALVVSPVNTDRVLPPVLTVGDKVSVTLAFLQRNQQPLNTGQPIYNYVDESAAGIVLSLGMQGAQPTAGTFTLTFGATTSPAIPYNVNAYTLLVILNAMASIIAAGGVTVSGQVGGPFQIRFITNGAQAAITVTTNGLFPASSIVVATTQVGASTNPACQVLTIKQTPVVQLSSWTAQPAAAITVTSISTTVIQQVAIPAGTYGGSFTLTYNGNTTVAIPFDAQLDLVAAAINALPGISGATVVPGQNYWIITIPGGAFALTGNAAGLQIPLFLTGTLDLTSQRLADMLSGATSAQVEFYIQATTTNVQTLFFGSTTLNAAP